MVVKAYLRIGTKMNQESDCDTGGTTDKTETEKKNPTLFFLYVPGGGVLGIIPAVVLARLEELLETPAMHAFHAADGVSVGAIVIAGLNIPDPENPSMPLYTAAETAEMIAAKVQKFFPRVKGRMRKLITSGLIHTARRFLDPAITDGYHIKDITDLCEELRTRAGGKLQPLVDDLQHNATQQWLTKFHRNKAYALCDEIRQTNPDLRNIAAAILSHVYERTQQTSRIDILFRKAALGVGDTIIRNWAREQDFLYDSKVIHDIFNDVFGDVRIGDCLRSTFISAGNAITGEKVRFFCRKENLLDIGPGPNEDISKNNHTLIDALMATSAHPLAVKPHETEDGILCTDPAVWHAPTNSVLQVVRAARAKNPDIKVKMVVLSTVDYSIKSMSKTESIARMQKNSLVGNLFDGHQLSQIQSYVMSDAKATMREELGDEDILEISPRLNPRTSDEANEFPSRNILDTRQENIERVLNIARRTLVEKDLLIRNLAYMMAENMHLLGQMDDEKYSRIIEKIKTSPIAPLDTGIGKEIPDIFERVLARPDGRLSAWFGNATRHLYPKTANDNTPQDKPEEGRKNKPKGPDIT